MTPLPQSGTAPRMAARGTPLGLGLGGAGGVAGWQMTGDPMAGIAGALAGQAVGRAIPAGVSRALLSPAGRAYLSNQVLGLDRFSEIPRSAGLTAALMNASMPARLPPPR
jgi:hypothetical protein